MGPKHDYRMTLKRYESFLKEKRGQGRGQAYRQGLTIHNLSSTGNSHRLYSWKTNRITHLFSDLELIQFYLFEWLDDVIDIREQFPLLPHSEVMDIVKMHDLTYFNKLKKQELNRGIIWMPTSDFRVTVQQGSKTRDVIYTVKPEVKLTEHQALKFEIEQHYWKRRDILWQLSTDKSLSKHYQLFRNIRKLRRFRDISNNELNTQENFHPYDIRTIANFMADLLLGQTVRLRHVVRRVDELFKIKKGTSLMIACHMIANGWWKINITKTFDPDSTFLLLNFQHEMINEEVKNGTI